MAHGMCGYDNKWFFVGSGCPVPGWKRKSRMIREVTGAMSSSVTEQLKLSGTQKSGGYGKGRNLVCL